MPRNETISEGRLILLGMILLNAIVLRQGFVAGKGWYNLLFLTVPLLVLSPQFLTNLKTKRMNRLFRYFSELGTRYGLSFSSLAQLRNSVMGVDGLNRKLLILFEPYEERFNHILLNLSEIRSCSVKKVYGSICYGSLRGQKLDSYLESISICFELRSGGEPIEVFFFKRGEDPASKLKVLSRKARDWETVLSKMLNRDSRKIA